MKIYQKLLQWLQQDQQVVLMLVVESRGSAPGRLGFKMIVASDGSMYGSIGGGLMEYELVEKSKSLLKKGRFSPFKIKQVHNKSSAHSSGMICSGSQQVAFYFLNERDLAVIEEASQAQQGSLLFDDKGLELQSIQGTNQLNETCWSYFDALSMARRIHLFGAGHVSVPTSKLLGDLGFLVCLYDNRKDLNTFKENHFVNHKQCVEYENILHQIKLNDEDLIILMTHKYTEDKLLVSQMLQRDWAYCGVLGSKNKIKTMCKELQSEGVASTDLQRLNAPVGLPIKSQTPQEIAVSIAAELIQWRNSLN